MKIYMLGIAGVGMGNLASLLKASGHEVSGVDTNVYPPMSDFLSQQGINYSNGFRSENLPQGTELVIVGNVCRSDNPEVLEAQKRGLELLSMP
jgi:UDP-N-acetylmuramate: L-alanyl-gamma-D-glutamyl-meso-diaminopimelate ligase